MYRDEASSDENLARLEQRAVKPLQLDGTFSWVKSRLARSRHCLKSLTAC
jgi:hypothetical protein